MSGGSDFKVDLTNCDREPIHLLGAIQPIGFLVAFTLDWQIARVSENFAAFTGVEPSRALGLPIDRIFDELAVQQITPLVAQLSEQDSVERLFGCVLLRGQGERRFDCSLHFSGGSIVLEAEPAKGPDKSDTVNVVRGMLSRLGEKQSDDQFYGNAARVVRDVTGFDRVMVYRFAHDNSGHVIAESARGDLVSFLGLHYPASDIPVQARALYLRSPFRIIADVNAEPVRIVPQLDELGRPLDLSMASLRSVSPIHIEYLKNMDVGASLSISIIADGKLWGLFACHHYSPRCPELAARVVAELFGQMFSLRLESRIRAALLESTTAAREAGERLVGGVARNVDQLGNAEWLAATIGRIVPCDGISVCIEDRITYWGSVPPPEGVEEIRSRLNSMKANTVFQTDCLSQLLPSAEAYKAQAAGVLAMPISRTPRDYVMLFRREQSRTVTWGGDPTKPVEYGPNGPRLTPRASFDAWLEEVRGRSIPFTPSEVHAADTLRASLVEVVLQLSEAAVEERKRALDRQQLLISELNHRVRNILTLIRSVMRQSGGANDIETYRSQLESRIESLARAHDQLTQQGFASASLQDLITTEAKAYLDTKFSRLILDGPAVSLSALAFSSMALVLHEMVTNSAKYGALSDNGNVSCTWSLEPDGDLLIRWVERDGPKVRPPTRRGFGTVLIERAMPHDLGGSSQVDYDPAGVRAEFRIPARFVELTPSDGHVPVAETAIVVSAPKSAMGSAPEDVLLVEDSLLIAMDTEDELLSMGVAKVRVASTVASALAEIDASEPDFALLDVNLGDETSIAVARRLHELGVPFAFATGYGESAIADPALKQVPVLVKPYSAAALKSVVLKG